MRRSFGCIDVGSAIFRNPIPIEIDEEASTGPKGARLRCGMLVPPKYDVARITGRECGHVTELTAAV